MTRRFIHFLAVVALGHLAFTGCVDAPQDEVSLALLSEGRSVDDLEIESGFDVSLTRADVAFGPLYLCPGSQAGELCDTARLEWTDSAVVDALDDSEQNIGTLRGVTGPIRSWMFDYGIASLLTQDRPLILDAAEQLGNVSLVLEGEAVLDGTLVPFEVEVVVQQGEEAESGVPVVRKSTSDDFDFEVTTASKTFVVAFDPAQWIVNLRRSHLETAAVEGQCSVGDDDSCDLLSFDSESDVARGIGQAMTSGVRPRFSLED